LAVFPVFSLSEIWIYAKLRSLENFEPGGAVVHGNGKISRFFSFRFGGDKILNIYVA
jgi:hypothetical protein